MRDVGEARIEIDEALSEPAESVQAGVVSGAGRERKTSSVIVMALVTFIALGVALWSYMRSNVRAPKQVARFVIPLSPADGLESLQCPSVAVSPDGQYVAYVGARGSSRQLYLKAMDELEGQPIEGTEGAQMPFFSPDSQWLGFQLADRRLMKMSVRGGAPVTITSSGGVDVRGASWVSDGSIVFTPFNNTGLSRVSANGGEPEVLTIPVREHGEKAHRLPEALPGGKAVLFAIGTGDIESWDDASIAVLSLETGEYHVLVEGGTNPRYCSTGHLVYARAGSLLAVPFDLDELRLKGAPVPVLQGVRTSRIAGNASFCISHDGSLLYAPGESWGYERRVLSLDRKGRIQSLIESPRAFNNLKISPDGRSLALEMQGANLSVWVYDLTRSTLSRLTFDFDNGYPIWTPDSRRVTFSSSRDGQWNLFWKSADGSDQPDRLTASEHFKVPDSWSPDGEVFTFREGTPTGGNIWMKSMEGDRAPKPILQTEFDERESMFSPNGRWIAYVSDESGRYEVYIRPFSGGSGKWQVSTEGGREPRWNPNGRELFYRNGAKMMVVDAKTDGELVLGEPKMLFENPSLLRVFDVSPDGQRFVMIEEGESQPAPTHLILVQNWGEELKRLVPTN
jgi:serine/threonine-protein kinase